jgi:hypothetical protein
MIAGSPAAASDCSPTPGCSRSTAGGHTAIGKSTCVDTAITDYLIAGDTPPNGTACAPDTVPFTTRASATAAPRPDIPAGLTW